MVMQRLVGDARSYICTRGTTETESHFIEIELNAEVRGPVTALGRDVPWVKAGGLVREPDAGDLPVRFEERDVETESRLHR